MDVSINRGTPKSSIYRWIFPHKPTIWGYHHFRKPPYTTHAFSSHFYTVLQQAVSTPMAQDFSRGTILSTERFQGPDKHLEPSWAFRTWDASSNKQRGRRHPQANKEPEQWDIFFFIAKSCLLFILNLKVGFFFQ